MLVEAKFLIMTWNCRCVMHYWYYHQYHQQNHCQQQCYI